MTISDTMSDDDVLMLIFAAGFSTAESVTDVSGRGVGMDVVRRNIGDGRPRGRALDAGAGTTIRIILPLTLAILDGMLVKVADEIYVLPLGAVMESLRPTDDMLCRFVGEERLYRCAANICRWCCYASVSRWRAKRLPMTALWLCAKRGLPLCAVGRSAYRPAAGCG